MKDSFRIRILTPIEKELLAKEKLEQENKQEKETTNGKPETDNGNNR